MASPRRLRSPASWIAALALVLALLLPGLRGTWDPDEGRYTNVAMHMVDSGNWLEPHRSETVGHWTKPPLTYWAIAASVEVFGRNPWAARLPATLSYLLCAWLAWRIARRLVPPAAGASDAGDAGRQAPLVFATMLLPFGAAQYITTDYLLAACETLAMWAFVEARFGDGAQRAGGHARRWLALMWAGFGLAFLCKGPPGLLPLLAVFAFDLSTPAVLADGSRRPRALQWWALPLFALVALPWYLAVVVRNPGLLDYFVGAEVVDRVASDDFNRHGEWYGWLAIYAPTLVVGTLPWTPALWRWLRALPGRIRAWRTRDGRTADRAGWLLALWMALPLLVFCISRSRMPLYILPLFVPLALLVARQRRAEGRGLPRWRWLLAWAVLLLALEAATASWPTHKDGAAWREAIAQRVPGRVARVNFVEDMARYSLNLEMRADVEKLSLLPHADAPRFGPDYDTDVATALQRGYDADALWITKQDHFPAVRERLRALGYATEVQGGPYERRTLFRVRPDAAPSPAPARSPAH
jgi:4-amino-4-deoxy-L-arabinose transferase-like glycosyltransferase